MASHKQMESDASSKFPGFFKVILERTLQAKKMEIPIKFMKNNGDLFLDDVNLIVSNCHSWKIGLTKSENKTYFYRNWNEFVKHFSIGKEYFLVFKLEKLSTFRVRIFEPSGCEVHYPSITTTRYPDNDHADSIKSEEGVVSTPAPCSSKKRTTHEEKSLACKFDVGEAEVAKGDDFEAMPSKAFTGNGKAIRASREFKTKLPCFKILMQYYNFNHNFVHLPSSFGRILKELPDYIRLQNSDGREWPVKVNKRLKHKCNRFTLGNGWAAFQKENNLKKGDVCAMELVSKNIWKVSVFRD